MHFVDDGKEKNNYTGRVIKYGISDRIIQNVL